MKSTLFTGLLLCSMALTACSQKTTKSMDTQGSDTDSGMQDTASDSSGLTLSPGVNTFDIVQEVDGVDVTRSYIVHTADDFDSSQSLPLMFAFHGGDGEGSDFVDQLADKIQEGQFIGVYPDGISRSWNIGREDSTADDVAFTQSILSALDGISGITIERPVAIGFSNGAAMVHKLAMNSSLFAAIVPQSSALTQAELPESTDAKVSVLQLHGTEDDSCPYDGGVGVMGHDFLAAEESAATWAAHNGCDDIAEESTHNNGLVTRFEWPNCEDGRAVVHYKLGAIGHSIPPDVDGDTFGIIFDFVSAAR